MPDPDPDRLTSGSAPNRAREPSRRSRRVHPVLKHGGYSGMSILPGEDPAGFKKLHEELIAEYAPTGQHEHEIVETIARLIWRKRCLCSYGLADFARQRYSAIKSDRQWRINHMTDSAKELPQNRIQTEDSEEPVDDFDQTLAKLAEFREFHQIFERHKLEEEHIRRQMGPAMYELANMKNVATTAYLLHELSIIDRIDGMIDRCLKRLLLVRGVKSISSSVSAAPNASG